MGIIKSEGEQQKQVPLEPMRARSLLLVAWIILCACQQIQGVDHFVGSPYNWPALYGFVNATLLRDWAEDQTFEVNDALFFAMPDDGVFRVSSDQVDACDMSGGTLVPRAANGSVIYRITEGDAGKTFGFISSTEIHCRTYFMRFQVTVQPLRNNREKGKRLAAIIAGVVAGLAAVIMITVLVLLFMKRKRYWHRLSRKGGRVGFQNSQSSDSTTKEISRDIEWAWGTQRFSYEELSGATQSFSPSQVLGEGGFGTVYKGVLPDSGFPVAVKRLFQFSGQGAREFMAEMNIISQLRHRNLVQLLGWCNDNEELILVYEFMPNGDLDELIFGYGEGGQPEPLSWKQRYNILCGVATALVYLHEEWEQRVVHRDVKTANVMLDGEFNARLGDFGLARLSAHSQAPRTTLVAGTIGYLAPEFNLSGKATDKTDVYAFGIVALEVSSARRPLTANCVLLDWVWELHKDEKLLDAIDPKIDVRSTPDEEGMKRMLQVALLCCHPDPSARPSMRQVFNILTGESPLPRIPRCKPVAYFADSVDY